jgi:hypothetical protein
VPGKRQRVDGAVGAAVAALRRDLRERLEHHVDHAQDRLGIAADRLRRAGVEQGRRRDHERDRIEHAGVRGHVAKHMLEGDVTGGRRGGIGNIHRAGARR